MADLKISELPALAGPDLDANDVAPVADLSASETKKLTLGDFFSEGVSRLTADGSIPGTKLVANSVTSTQLGPASVTASELAPDSVGTTALQVGAVSGSAGSKATIAAGSIGAVDLAAGSVTSNAVGPAAIGTTALQNGSVTDAKLAGGISPSKLADTTAASQVLAGPTTGGGTVTARLLQGVDLPTATSATQGAVKVSGQGLRLNAGALEIDNDVAGSGVAQIVTYDAKGLVTGGRGIGAPDLPVASTNSVGVVSVPASSGLTVSGLGELAHQSAIAAGTATKVTFDASGHITATGSLTPGDIPDLDASKLVSGTLSAALIANRSITQAKLADYSVSYIQEATPVATTGAHHIGTLWFQESTARLSMFNGNSWMSVGQGALSQENLRFCGLFDATNGTITALTQFGTSESYTVGQTIQAATNTSTGVYFVCDTPGNGTAVTAGVSYDAGDWIVSLGQARGWQRVDTLNGAGGGGGGASKLDDLTDVTVTTPAVGDVLVYTGTGWVNQQANGDPGTYI